MTKKEFNIKSTLNIVSISCSIYLIWYCATLDNPIAFVATIGWAIILMNNVFDIYKNKKQKELDHARNVLVDGQKHLIKTLMDDRESLEDWNKRVIEGEQIQVTASTLDFQNEDETKVDIAPLYDDSGALTGLDVKKTKGEG